MLSSGNALVQTGAADYSIPIKVPPGRNGLAPNLTLRYNSLQGNGWIGMGWDINIASIQRSTKHGVGYDMYTNDYVLTVNGSSTELVARPDWGNYYWYGAKIEDSSFSEIYSNPHTKLGESADRGTSSYGTKIEDSLPKDSFSKIHFSYINGFELTTKDGKKYFFGSTSQSRQLDPNNVERVSKWCLDRVEDTNGNFMTITYERPWDQSQIYLKQIDYTGNGSLVPSNSVKFFYDELRTDAPPLYTTKFKVVTDLRLKTIEVYGEVVGIV